MGWDLSQCEDEELIKVADRLNRCNESKVMLEIELCNEEFKLKYIHRRRKLTASKARSRMLYIVPFTLVELGCIVGFISSIIEHKNEGYSEGVMISMLLSLLGFFFCGIVCIKLWLPELKLLGKFNVFSRNKDEDKGAVTFDTERRKSEERITVLKTELKTIEDEIKHLSAKKRERELYLRTQLLEEKAKVFLGEKPASDIPQASKSGLSFSIKKEEISNVQAEEMLKNVTEELRMAEREKVRLELEDKKLQDGIIDIDLGIIDVRDKITAFILIGTILTIIVSMFSGPIMHILGVVWCAIILPYMFWLFTVCRMPLVLYLVEHDHKQIQDYAFTHSLTPLYKKRRELAREIADNANEIHKLESKKQEIENLGLL